MHYSFNFLLIKAFFSPSLTYYQKHNSKTLQIITNQLTFQILKPFKEHKKNRISQFSQPIKSQQQKMSKQPKKDKKGDQSSAMQQQFEMQKRQLLDCQFTIKKLEHKINYLMQENSHLKKSSDDLGGMYNETIKELTIKYETNEKRLFTLSHEKTLLEIDNKQQENKIKSLERSLMDQQQARMKDFEQAKKNYHFEVAKYESQLSEYKLYMGQRDELEQEREELRERIEIEKANKLREIADKEREKVQATDKIKDQMNHKIKDMERNLVSLKRQQLETTTRLTMLQNHQLTSQLQYQSKQTQKLIFINQQLQQKVNSLQQQLDIHKEVQDELAKRSHFSKGVIRKLNLKINDLESELQRLKSQVGRPQQQSRKGESQHELQSSASHNKTAMNQASFELSIQSNKRLITSLEQELEKSEKRYIELLTSYENLEKEKEALNNKLISIDQKANQIFKVMHRFYEQVVLKELKHHSEEQEHEEDFLKENSPPYEFNLKHLRQSPVKNWKIQDLTLTVQILLNLIQPYMVRPNLLVPAVRKNIIFSQGLTQRRSDSICKSLPKLQTERKEVLHTNKCHDIPINIASKIVGSNLREWGQTVRLNKIPKMGLTRKYKVAQSFRN